MVGGKILVASDTRSGPCLGTAVHSFAHNFFRGSLDMMSSAPLVV